MVKDINQGFVNLLPFLAVTQIAKEYHSEKTLPLRWNRLHKAAFLQTFLASVKFWLRHPRICCLWQEDEGNGRLLGWDSVTPIGFMLCEMKEW